jgi:hypothetical protein
MRMRRAKIVVTEVTYGAGSIQKMAQQFIELLIQSQYTLSTPVCNGQAIHSHTVTGERG